MRHTILIIMLAICSAVYAQDFYSDCYSFNLPQGWTWQRGDFDPSIGEEIHWMDKEDKGHQVGFLIKFKPRDTFSTYDFIKDFLANKVNTDGFESQCVISNEVFKGKRITLYKFVGKIFDKYQGHGTMRVAKVDDWVVGLVDIVVPNGTYREVDVWRTFRWRNNN